MADDPVGRALTARLSTSPPMIVLRPGDRVLVAVTEDPPTSDVEAIATGLQETFPGVDFTILTGVASIAVSGGSEAWAPDSKPPSEA